jgi:EAL and modified HD-GYP domain-containing signal transduction protein
MTPTSSSPPLLVFRVLADHTGKPAGLLMDVGPGDAEQLMALSGTEDFSALSDEVAAYYREDLSPPLAEALDLAGWKQLVPGSLLREDEKLDQEAISDSGVLIEGDWCMAAPPKLTGAQAASRALALQLAALIASDAHTHDIEALLRKDPTLSYHLLRLVNTLGMGMGRKITSFSQAILILGRQQLRRWVNLMLFAARSGDPRSAMLLARVAVRGRLLEQLTKARGGDKHAQDQAFIAGMFSLLGVLFGMPLDEVLKPLSMSDEVSAAVLEYKGELGEMLRLCEAVELGDFDYLAARLAVLDIDEAAFDDALVEANRWMLGALRGSQSGPAA